MASPFIPSSFIYGDIPGGGALAIIQVATTNPTVTQNKQSPGTFWLNPEPIGNGNLYYLAGYVAGVPQWELIGTASGSIVAVAGTANQITENTVAGVATLSLPVAITTPGSLTTTTNLVAGTSVAAGTTVTSGTSMTATTSVAAGTTVTGGTGLIATTGNVTTSAVGAGFVTVPTVASGAASGTVAANGRVVSVTFTGVSIAGGATQVFTTSNTSITGSGTVLLISHIGATTGSSLNIQSVVNSASQSVITVENGTGLTTTVANITFTYLVLN